MAELTDHQGCWLIDLDGVLWLSDKPIAGSAEAVRRLFRDGRRVGFVTNNSFARPAELLEKLHSHGVDVKADALLTSSVVAAELCEIGSHAFVLGGAGIVEALENRGVVVVERPGLDQRIDVVVVGLDQHLTYERLTFAVQAVLRGAQLLGTNDDPIYPTADGPLPGGGSVLAAVAFATGATPTIAGKPYAAMLEAVRHHLGDVALVVGDRPSTDGALASGLDVPFALVRSGVTGKGEEVDPRPAFDVADLAQLVDLAGVAR